MKNQNLWSKKMDTTKIGIILAGGNGTRMFPVTRDKIPKPLVKLREKPLLYHTLDFFVDNDVKNIVVATSHLHEHIEDMLALYGNKADVEVVVEESPLGTAGAIKNAVESVGINENFYVTYADTLTSVDLSEMGEFYRDNCSHVALMALAPVADYGSDRIVRLSPDYRICRTVRYPTKEDLAWGAHVNNQPLVDAGVYVLNMQSLKLIDEGKFSTDTFIERLADEGILYGFPTTALYFNVGTPAILSDAEQRWEKEREDNRIPFRRIRQCDI